MHYILQFFKDIGFYLQLFFLTPAPFAHAFQIVLIALIVFLGAAALRPRRWKWIVLFCSEFIYFIAGMLLVAQGFSQENVYLLYYGSIAAVLSFIVFWVTLWRSIC